MALVRTDMHVAGRVLNQRGEPIRGARVELEQDFVLQSVPRYRERLIAEMQPPPLDEDPSTRLVQWDIVLRRG